MEEGRIDDRMTGGGNLVRKTGSEGHGEVGALSVPGTTRNLETAEGLGTCSEFEKETHLSEDPVELKFLGGVEAGVSTVEVIGTGASSIRTPSIL